MRRDFLRGASQPITSAGRLLLISAGLSLAVSGCTALTQPSGTTANTAPTADGAMIKKDGVASFTGTVLAGSSAPLLDFNQVDYQAALNSGKVVFLYYYANWCPLCKDELPSLYGAFNSLDSDQVVGFRVNFNDSDTDDAETALAREHGVAYQHTKVAIKGGARVLKSPETWNQQRYLDEINALIK